MRRSTVGKRSLVTGASSGIGRHLALELARQGSDLLLFARRQNELDQLADEIRQLGRRAVVVAGDVTSAEDRQSLLKTVSDELGGLDILINNAGISAHGLFAKATAERMRKIMEVNFFAAVELTRESLPLLQAGNNPLVVNVGSILGARGIPFNTEYCASKFALHGWTEALRTELTPLGIDVLLASPGTTDTEFFSHLIEKDVELPWGARRGAKPSGVAKAIVRAIRKGKRTVTPSISGRALLCLHSWAPGIVDRLMRRYV